LCQRPNKRNNYALSLAYDTVHNITRKTQTNTVTNNGGSTVTQKLTTYDFGYAYAGPRPHVPTRIGERLTARSPGVGRGASFVLVLPLS